MFTFKKIAKIQKAIIPILGNFYLKKNSVE